MLHDYLSGDCDWTVLNYLIIMYYIVIITSITSGLLKRVPGSTDTIFAGILSPIVSTESGTTYFERDIEYTIPHRARMTTNPVRLRTESNQHSLISQQHV